MDKVEELEKKILELEEKIKSSDKLENKRILELEKKTLNTEKQLSTFADIEIFDETKRTLEKVTKDYLKKSEFSEIEKKIDEVKSIRKDAKVFENTKEDIIKNTKNYIDEIVDKKTEEIKTEIVDNNEFNKRIKKLINDEKIKPEDFSILKDFRYEATENKFDLLDEIKKIEENAKSARSISYFTGFLALLFLLFVFFAELIRIQEPGVEFDEVYFITRFSIFILLETFFFVFKSKEKNLYEIRRYYINELHNIIVKDKMLKLSLNLYPDPDIDLNFIIKNLTVTERNFIMGKNQTTIELEKTKTDNNLSNNIIGDFLTKILSKPTK